MAHHVLSLLRKGRHASFCTLFVTAIFITWAVFKTRLPKPVIERLPHTRENIDSGLKKTAALERKHIKQQDKLKEKVNISDEIHFQKSELLPTVKIENLRDILKTQKQRQRQVKLVCTLIESGFYNHTKYYSMKRRDFHNLIADHYHRFMYCPIKKVSSSSWNYFFKSMIDNEIESRQLWMNKHPGDWSRLKKRWARLNNSGFSPALNSSVDPEALKGYFKFIMVRHPLDRLASAYLSMVVAKSQKDQTIDFEKFLIVAALSRGQDVNWLPDHLSKNNRHWKPYLETCHPCSAQFDFIARVETQQEDIRELLPKLNATEYIDVFPHINVGAQHSGKYKQMYASIPDDILHNLFEKYQPDADMFGYSFRDYLQNIRQQSTPEK